MGSRRRRSQRWQRNSQVRPLVSGSTSGTALPWDMPGAEAVSGAAPGFATTLRSPGSSEHLPPLIVWFSPVAAAPDETHQVRARHDQGGLRLRTLRETRHGAAESFQRQTRSEVHQEEGGSSHHRKEWQNLCSEIVLPSITLLLLELFGSGGNTPGGMGGGWEGGVTVLPQKLPRLQGPRPASFLPRLQSWGEERVGLGASRRAGSFCLAPDRVFAPLKCKGRARGGRAPLPATRTAPFCCP